VGKGIDMAREADLQSGGSGIHADVLEDFKDQLLVCLLKRLADKNGHVSVPIAEVDATGRFVVSFSVSEGVFNFLVSKKQ